MRVLFFSKALERFFFILRRIQRNIMINEHRFFAKSIHIKYHENPSVGSQVVPRGHTNGRTVGGENGQTDKQKEREIYERDNCSLSQFSYAPKICLFNENTFSLYEVGK